MGIGQHAVFARAEHVRDEAVGQEVHAYVAHPAREREGQHIRIGCRARRDVRYQPREHAGRAEEQQPRREGVDLVQPLAEEAEEHGRGEAARGLHRQYRAVLHLVYAEVGHGRLGVGAEAVAVDSVERKARAAEREQRGPAPRHEARGRGLMFSLHLFHAAPSSEEPAAADELVLYVAVVGEIYRTLQPRGDVALPRRAVAAVVHDDGVELPAGPETAGVEELPSPGGAEVEGLLRGEGAQAAVHQPPAELGYLYGVGHGAEDARHRAARHVAAEAGAQPHVQEAAHGGDAAGDVHVRGRAVRDVHAPLAYELQLRLLREHAVSHDRRPALAAEEAEAVVGRSVKGAVREERVDELHLGAVLGEVRLHGKAALAP